MSRELNEKLNRSLDEISEENKFKDRDRFSERGRSGRFPRERSYRSEDRGSSPYLKDTERGDNFRSRNTNTANVTNRLYVGNLPYHTTWQRLKDIFKEVGPVMYADVLRNDRGLSKGCGIVEFETREDAIKAIKQLNDTDLDGRPIFVREDREDKKSDNYKSKKGCQIFVGNLSYETTWQDLKDEFRKCGDVVRTEIMMSAEGRSRGGGTVLFENPADARRAIREYDNTEFMGRIIQVREDRFA